MKTFYFDKLSPKELDELCERKAVSFGSAEEVAQSVLKDIKSKGDKALFAFSEKYDNVRLDSFLVQPKETESAKKRTSTKLKNALKQAYSNIERFHSAQQDGRISLETMPGVNCYVENRPIERVGLYVPGGTASLPSTVLMLAIPAKLAGSKEVILCTPPGRDGSVNDAILYAADKCGVDRIYKIGGAQAIGAMAYGTETIPKVFKIFGPGNRYVTAAKQLVSADPKGAAIDMPAGPTEVLVIADASSRADFVAADLLSQAEHGPDSMAVLVCTDAKKNTEIINEVKKQIKTLPRKEITVVALENSFSLITGSISEAINFANRFAPEHLILGFDRADEWTDKVINAGSVFIGPYSCESAGDYASGTNHSLPTYGYARAYSGVSVASFQKRITFQKVTKEGAKNIGPTVSAIAEAESLEAHKRAMEIRL